MVTAFKTKTVADELGVNPTTVQRWIKFFKLDCEVNDLGHYVLTEDTVKTLKSIHHQLSEGKRLKDVTVEGISHKKEETDSSGIVSSQIFNDRFGQILVHVDQLEKKLSEKADEVVEYQMLQHRQEIDDLSEMLRTVDRRLKSLEDNLSEKEKQVVYMNKGKKNNKPPRKRMLANIFSFMVK
ncbi:MULTISPECIES: chromosome-anchoring protein RacA [Alteribacter]|uniref:Chromosome-anchoring protein RacA n=1 Tax=Alteribacter keqinensis TaxID=2483800 RepID=A0A3M7TUF9_9BACI|nr:MULTISPECIES: chromosome-anchoring protein RacA [Alteribacter]MBM7094604.1 chromosome-anchoring protein RacA [Alteribacter salitolerans]RNA69187.1 chromosome-anchoring protein RacA [Alteribacter keqinensis]